MLGFLLVSAMSLSFAVAEPDDDDSHDEIEDEFEDEDEDEVDDDLEHEEERGIEIEVEDDKVEINSYSQNKDTEDKFEIDIELSDYVEIEVGYSSETESESEGIEIEEESEFEFSVKFKKIIEFVDLNENGIYEGDEIDEFVQEYEFTSFKPIDYASEVLESGHTLHKLNVSTTDDVFKIHLYMVEEFEIVDGNLLTPMEIKMDILITNFNYAELESQLALYVKLESEYEYEYEEKTHDEEEGWAEDEDGVKTKIKGENGFFTWEDFALVDGVEMPVEYTPIADDDDDSEEERIYFNYARGDSIVHDPKVGFAVLTANPTNWLTIGLIAGGAVAAVATVALIVVGARKRR